MEKWQIWPYLSDLLDVLLTEKDIVLFKARQIGWTWCLAGFGLWKVKFSEAARGLYISKNEGSCWEFLGKSKFIENHLPKWLQFPQKHADNRALLDFVDNGSVIQALPSTIDAGAGTDATFVFRDELRYHPNAQQNFAAVGPAIDAGGQLVDLSTIDKEDASSHFTERINRAMAGANQMELPSGLKIWTGGDSGATLVFGGWDLRPAREAGLTKEEWWELRVEHKYSRLVKESEYPRTIEEALRPIQSTAFFDLGATEAMLQDLMKPQLEVEGLDLAGGLIKIFKRPQVGRRYVLFTDPSEGIEDPFHTVVMDAQTFEGVAEAEGWVSADQCAEIHDRLARFYNKAYNTWDANASAGGVFSETIKRLGTPQQALRRDLDSGQVKQPDRMGWRIHGTSHGSMRETFYSSLREAVFKRLLVVHNRTSIDQFQKCFYKDGKPQVPRGMHDDALTAWGGAWQLRKYAPAEQGEVRSIPYREVWR